MESPDSETKGPGAEDGESDLSPQERRQKHQSAWILERCIRGVRQHVTRRLPAQAPQAPAGLEDLYAQPESYLLVFPGPNARPLSEVLDGKVRHLILVDATWRFAREMAADSSSDPLSLIRRVELTPPPGTRPVFVVRKPLLLGAREPETAEGSRDDAAGNDDERWGFSTAEAAALALDEISELRRDASREASPPPRLAWRTVTAALRAYAQIQLEHTARPRMRTDRPGFIPKLYEEARVAGADSARV